MDQIDPALRAAAHPDAETAGAGSKIFISYASQDVAVADKLCAALEASGLPCWIAPRDVRAGESYAAAIVQAINVCRLLVLVLSLAAAEKNWENGMAYQISYVYASRNDPDVYWLERAYKQHDAGLLSMLHDPMFRNIERTPQFQSLLQKMRLLR